MKRNLFGLSLFFLIIVLLNACFWKSDYGFETKLFPVKAGDKWGYIDHKGKYVINPQFESAEFFRCGLAQVSNNDGVIGFINDKGNYVILPKYIDATPFSCGLAFVVEEGGYITCINTKGDEVFKLQQAKYAEWFTEDLAAFCNKDEKWGFVNKKGEVVINPQFKNVRPFKEGLAAVCDKDGKWGFIDKEGVLVINYQFNKVDNFSEGLAAFSNGEKCGFISKSGEYVINPQFDMVNHFCEGKAAVIQGKLLGFIDKKGQFIINPQFDYETEPFFADGLVAVSSGDLTGYIDENGKYVINPQFKFGYPFIDGLAAVYSGDQFGFIDKKGKYVINPQFDRVFEDLYEMFSVSAPSVASDYYDANEFVNRWFDLIATTTCFDAVCAGSTLQSIEDYSKYESSLLYSRLVSYNKAQKITDDIYISNVNFYFDKDIYVYDYWTYSKILQHSAPICAVRYTLDLKNDAIDKGKLVAKTLKNKFADNFEIQFEENVKGNVVSYVSMQEEGKLSFAIYATQYFCEIWIGPNGADKLKEQIDKNSYIAEYEEAELVEPVDVDEEEYEEVDDEPAEAF